LFPYTTLFRSRDTSGREVGALALVAVRQQQGHAGTLAPLLLTGTDVFVDDGLGTVDEVTELCLPHDQRFGPGQRVTVFEAQRRVLAQQRVVRVGLRGAVVELLARCVGLAGLAVHDRGMAVGVRTPAAVLTDKTH